MEMTRTNHFGALAITAAALVASLLALVVLTKPAEAITLPGDSPPKKIAFESNRVTKSNPTGDYEIYTMNPNGTGLIQLTYNTSDDREPDWSPGRTKIAFQRNGEIYVMKSDGTNQTNITNNSAYDYN